MDFEQLKNQISPELIAKAKACKTHEELTDLLKAEMIDLTAEQMDAISGGIQAPCPNPNEKTGPDW